MSSYAPGYYPQGGGMPQQRPQMLPQRPQMLPQRPQSMPQQSGAGGGMLGMSGYVRQPPQAARPVVSPQGGQNNLVKYLQSMRGMGGGSQGTSPSAAPPAAAPSHLDFKRLIDMAQNSNRIGPTGQPLAGEGFGPAGRSPMSGLSQGMALPTPQRQQSQMPPPLNMDRLVKSGLADFSTPSRVIGGPAPVNPRYAQAQGQQAAIPSQQVGPPARIDPNTYTKSPLGIAGGGAPMNPQSPHYAQAQQFNAMQGQQAAIPSQQVGPPAQGGIAPGAFAVAGDPRNLAKGGFAVKPVWDKKRPEDLGKPKSLSVKRKKSAKARAASAGRPYPNLVDNMAAARKKGK